MTVSVVVRCIVVAVDSNVGRHHGYRVVDKSSHGTLDTPGTPGILEKRTSFELEFSRLFLGILAACFPKTVDAIVVEMTWAFDSARKLLVD